MNKTFIGCGGAAIGEARHMIGFFGLMPYRRAPN